eukprot:c7324_g1_i1 orf=74-643(+)
MGAYRNVANALGSTHKKISPKKLLQQKKTKLVESQSQAALLFHCSGVNMKQWRELKNSLVAIQGATLFQPNYKGVSALGINRRDEFSAKVATCPGPTCMLYLKEGTGDGKWSKLLPPGSQTQNMILLYGKHRSDVLNHVDVKKAASLDLAVVYGRGIFPTFFQSMGFLSGLDKLKAASNSGRSGEGQGS